MSSKTNEECDDTAETTHHKPKLATIGEEDSMDETSTTRHEPLNLKDEKVEDLPVEEAPPAPGGEDRKDDGKEDISLRLHRKVAEIAAKAYRRASEQSNVLSQAKLADVALVKFEELEIGKFLGKGSFSDVHEITKITAAGDGTDSEASWDIDGLDGLEGDGDGTTDRPTFKAGNVAASKKAGSGGKHKAVRVSDPRKLLTMHHQRTESGTFRYAIKFLKEEVRAKPQKYAVGTADLVVEGFFLASLSHPNIIKVRGLPEGGVKSLVSVNRGHGYFLILDRLFDTLSDRIYGEWQQTHQIGAKKKFGFLTNKKDAGERNKDLAVRLKVAFDISAALKYLHSKSIIYRDLKPENLGFDVRGDIKLFDLGLVKELHPNERDRQGNWRLSMAGTPRYMAPECGMYHPYNLSADVYSFNMLLWEILTLEKPLKNYTYTRLKNEIFIDGERPPIKKVFNKRMRDLISAGWSQKPSKRPTMEAVYDELKGEYLRLAPQISSSATAVSHNRRRSTFVARPVNRVSVRHLMRLNTVESDSGEQGGVKNE